MQPHDVQTIVTAKVVGLSAGTMGSGLWAWLGENHQEIGAMCSLFGALCLGITLWRNRGK